MSAEPKFDPFAVNAVAYDMPVECWVYSNNIAPALDVPVTLRSIADRLEETGGALLSLLVSPDGPTVQAIVDLGPCPSVPGEEPKP